MRYVTVDRARARTLKAVLALAAVCVGALIVGAEAHGDVRVLAHIVAGAVLFGAVYGVVALLLAFFARRR
jgi:hypothetical protein